MSAIGNNVKLVWSTGVRGKSTAGKGGQIAGEKKPPFEPQNAFVGISHILGHTYVAIKPHGLGVFFS
jgi:hypothetical protein